MNLIQKIAYFILEIQEKILTQKLKGNFDNVYSNNTSKRIVTQGCSLNLESKTKSLKQKVETDVENILRENKNDSSKLIEYVKNRGTKVYVLPSAQYILSLIDEEKGFIVGVSGIKSLFLNIILNKKPSLKFEPVFIIDSKNPETYEFLHQFYKWYSWKMNMPGFDQKAQESFKKFNNTKKQNNMDNLKLNDMLAMKEAIARDIEAIDFVFKLAKNVDGSKHAAAKIAAGGASI